MSYTGRPEQQHQLRQMIRADIQAPPGSNRSAVAIIRAMNRYLRERGRERQCIEDIDNKDRYIRNFALQGKSWKSGDVEKGLLWEFYEYENGALNSHSASVNQSEPEEFFPGRFFVNDDIMVRPTDPIIGKFLIYKRSITNPASLVVRGYIKFSIVTSKTRVIRLDEVHINRTHKSSSLNTLTEFWFGTVTPRERGYCMITRENRQRTPKFAVFETHTMDQNRAMSMSGYSIECVENWGPGSIFKSGIYLERVPDDFNYEDSDLVDLVPISQLRKSNKYVIKYLGAP